MGLGCVVWVLVFRWILGVLYCVYCVLQRLRWGLLLLMIVLVVVYVVVLAWPCLFICLWLVVLIAWVVWLLVMGVGLYCFVLDVWVTVFQCVCWIGCFLCLFAYG